MWRARKSGFFTASLGITFHQLLLFAMKQLLSMLLLSFAPLLSMAAPPSEESIAALFKVMKTESLIDSVYASIEPAMRQGMIQASAGRTLTDEQSRIMELAPQKLSAILRTELSWEKMLPMQIAIYRETFDQSEIDGLISFYSSSIGQSFVNKMPVVTQKAMSSMQTYMQAVTPKLQAAMQQILADAKISPRQ